MSQITRTGLRSGNTAAAPMSARRSSVGGSSSTSGRPSSASREKRGSRFNESKSSTKWKDSEDTQYPKSGETTSDRPQSRSTIRRQSTSSNPGKERRSSTTSTSSSSILDRLTNPLLYTGTHSHRFDKKTGRGRGLKGRDSTPKSTGGVPVYRGGQVADLSQILRN